MPAASTKTESPYAPFYPVFRKLLVFAIIVTVVLGSLYFYYRDKSHDGHNYLLARTGNDIASLSTMLETYQVLNGTLPSNAQGPRALVEKPVGEPQPRKWRPLMTDLPVDRWGNEYLFEIPGRRSGKSYDLYSKGKDRVAGTADDIGNWPIDLTYYR